MVTIEERDYFTVTEAARRLDVSPSTVWRWIKAQRLPAYRVGARKIRIKKDDLSLVAGPARPATLGSTTSGAGYVFVRPSEAEIATRQEVVARIFADQQGRSIAPLTTADLIRQVRDEREERYRSWLKSSS